MSRTRGQQGQRHQILIMRLAGKLHQRNFLKPEHAQELWSRLEEASQRLDPGGVLVIDFAGVGGVGVRFLEAMLQVLAAVRTHHPGRGILVKTDGTDSDVARSLEIVLRQRGQSLPVQRGGVVRIIGRLTKAQKETVAIAGASKSITSAELARRLHIGPGAASNRLHDLYEVGLLSRQEETAPHQGGRRFVYFSVPRLRHARV